MGGEKSRSTQYSGSLVERCSGRGDGPTVDLELRKLLLLGFLLCLDILLHELSFTPLQAVLFPLADLILGRPSRVLHIGHQWSTG